MRLPRGRERFEEQFRTVLGHLASGVAIVTALQPGAPIGMTVQALCSLSLDPPLILVCAARTSKTWPRMRERRALCVNLLAEGQDDLAVQFARSGTDKYAGVKWTPAPASGNPVLAGALAWIDCALEEEHPSGDHTIAVCRVLDLAAHPGSPLLYFQSRYHRILEIPEHSPAEFMPWPM